MKNRKHKENQDINKNDLDFSGVAEKLLSIVLKKVDPLTYNRNNIFGDIYFLSCFGGKDNIVSACCLRDYEIKNKSVFEISICNQKTLSSSYIFTYIIPSERNIKKINTQNIYGHVICEGHEYRDENCFSISSKNMSLSKWMKYILDIVKKNFIGCTVEAAPPKKNKDLLGLDAFNGEDQDSVQQICYSPTMPKKKPFKIPNIEELKDLISKLE